MRFMCATTRMDSIRIVLALIMIETIRVGHARASTSDSLQVFFNIPPSDIDFILHQDTSFHHTLIAATISRNYMDYVLC